MRIDPVTLSRSINRFAIAVILTVLLAFAGSAFATGLAECVSGPKENWVPKEDLEKMLVEKGWEVRKIKEDGGCWEVYALNEKGERVEAYFHPDTLEPVEIEKH